MVRKTIKEMAITVVKTTEGLLKIETFNVTPSAEDREYFVPKLDDEGNELEDQSILVMTTGLVDENLNPLSEIVKHELMISEEEAHKEIRLKAASEEKFIKKLSTDPDWNPGYKSKKK
jgi:hypothetical protein